MTSAVPVDYIALFILGMVSGTTVCGVGCLTHLGPYLLGSACGFSDGVRSTLSYLGGKVVTYGVWGGLAGGACSVLTLDGLGGRWPGIMLIGTGILLPVFNRKRCPKKILKFGNRGTLFTLGAVTSILPCPTMLGLLAAAGRTGSAAVGSTCGVIFGIGLVCSPLVIAGGGLGMLAGRLGLEVAGMQRMFQIFAMVTLIAMGVRLLLEV